MRVFLIFVLFLIFGLCFYSIKMVFMWTSGDIFKIVYFLFNGVFL